MNFKTLIIEQQLLSEFSYSERNEIKQIAEELRPLFENLNRDIYSQDLLNEGLFDRISAKSKGAFAGAKQFAKNLSGDESVDPKLTAKIEAINSRLNTFKKNVGTYTAQYQKDMQKLGGDKNPTLSKLYKFTEKTLSDGPSKIDIKDTSLMGKASDATDFAKKQAVEKMLPVIQKTLNKVGEKMEVLYQKSGLIKNFDDKYNSIAKKFKDSNPE